MKSLLPPAPLPAPITLCVRGDPAAQPRARGMAFRSKKSGKWTARVYNPDNADGWKNRIAVEAIKQRPESPWDGPLRIDAAVFFARPQYLLKPSAPEGKIRHTAKPDRDNLDKAILDTLKRARFFKDDAQVCEGEVRKYYAAKGASPGAVITITFLEPDR